MPEDKAAQVFLDLVAEIRQNHQESMDKLEEIHESVDQCGSMLNEILGYEDDGESCEVAREDDAREPRAKRKIRKGTAAVIDGALDGLREAIAQGLGGGGRDEDEAPRRRGARRGR